MRCIAAIAIAFPLSVGVLTSPAITRAAEAPPPPPYKAGPAVDGTLGVYAPLGRLRRVSSPGPWVRVAIGWELTKWIGVFVEGDAAFLSTDRAPPPPGERGYVLFGFQGGLRTGIPIGLRVRIPFRFELGAHKTDDNGVLATYGFGNAHNFGLSYAAMLGLEWRATGRHFGLAVEGGIRNDASLNATVRPETPWAIVSGVVLRYTL